jgi:hypothetical protein
MRLLTAFSLRDARAPPIDARSSLWYSKWYRLKSKRYYECNFIGFMKWVHFTRSNWQIWQLTENENNQENWRKGGNRTKSSVLDCMVDESKNPLANSVVSRDITKYEIPNWISACSGRKWERVRNNRRSDSNLALYSTLISHMPRNCLHLLMLKKYKEWSSRMSLGPVHEAENLGANSTRSRCEQLIRANPFSNFGK